MKVITGSARGRNLDTLRGDDITRPTSQMIKEVMFSAVQFHVAGARVLDLYAGSGQLGIEALSRGAGSCVFVDASRDAVEMIKSNLKKTGLYTAARVLTGDVPRFVQSARDRYDLIFADPPYKKGIVPPLLPLLKRIAAPGAFVICETEKGCELPDAVEALTLKKRYQHGLTRVWLYQNSAEPEFFMNGEN